MHTPRRPGGQCDGVIFLGKGHEYHETPSGVGGIRTVTAENLALRYLRPMGPAWRALQKARNRQKKEQLGVARPHGVEWLFTPEMTTLAMERERPLEWLFSQDSHCISVGSLMYQSGEQADQERNKWHVYRVAEDVWALVYVPASE